MYEYFVQKFRLVYSPKQELSLDAAMFTWREVTRNLGHTIQGKITKYGILVRMVCEVVLRYICNVEIYAAEGKTLEDTVYHF